MDPRVKPAGDGARGRTNISPLGDSIPGDCRPRRRGRLQDEAGEGFPLRANAHRLMESNEAGGKIVVRL